MFALSYGEEGIVKCGEILKEELERAMRLLGVMKLSELNEKYVNATRLERLVFTEGSKL